MAQSNTVTTTLSLVCPNAATVADLRAIVAFADENSMGSDSRVFISEERASSATKHYLSISKVVPQ